MTESKDIVRIFQNLTKSKTRQNKLLSNYIQKLDKECRTKLLNIKYNILAEKKIAYQIRTEAEDLKRQSSSTTELVEMRHGRSTEPLLRKSQTFVGNDQEMSISGQKMHSGYTRLEPKMVFWSQDASTKLPVMTSFYGFRLSLQRSMTEVKLLGESMYSENKREIQSADPKYVKDFAQQQMDKLRQIKTSGMSRFVSTDDFHDGAPPPPSRENNPQANACAMRKFPRIGELVSDNRKCDPEEINLNLKKSEESENLPHINRQRREKLKVVLAGSPNLPDKRKSRQSVRVLSFKTREEATKHYRKLLEDKNAVPKPEVPKVHVVSELEKSYTFVPVVKEEINRPKTDIENECTPKGGQYTKSTFGLNMQNAISRKVLNKTSLPMAFRKNHNTFLKHYGTPFMEEKTRHYNSPDTRYAQSPLSLTN